MPPADAETLAGDFVTLLRRILYVPAETITAHTRLADLGLDSLDLVEVGLELESLTGHELPDNAVFESRTIADLAARLVGRAPALSFAA